MDYKKLFENFDGEFLESSSELEPFSRDASIFVVTPSLVLKPKTVSALEYLVQTVTKHKNEFPKLSLTARAAGTDMSGGSLTESVMVDFTAHFNNCSEVEADSITTQTGVYYRDFEKKVQAKGLLLPSYPASKELCTIGGMVANNSAGEKSLSYGKTDRYVTSLRVILADGKEHLIRPLSAEMLQQKLQNEDYEGKVYREIYNLLEANYNLLQDSRPKVSKNSSGYALWNVWDKKTFDLTKLFVGSQGTLGFVTEATFDLVKPKTHSELLVIFLKDLSELGHIVKTVMDFGPESFESYDDHTLKFALRYLPEIIAQMKGGAIKLGFQFLPELWMTLTGGIPKLVLIAEFTGDSEAEVLEKLDKVRLVVKEKYHVPTHLTKSPQETQKYWTIRRESFSLLRKHVRNKHTAPFIDDIVVRPEYLPEFLPKLNKIFEQYPHLIYTIAGHAGDGNFHIIPLMNLADPAERAIIPKLSDSVYDLVLEYHGSITGEHNDGLIRTPYVEKMFGSEVTDLFEQVKHILDPQNIFNPGKKVGGNLQYALDHITHK
jgi:FAD/FMN-containing dehydrogenase